MVWLLIECRDHGQAATRTYPQLKWASQGPGQPLIILKLAVARVEAQTVVLQGKAHLSHSSIGSVKTTFAH